MSTSREAGHNSHTAPNPYEAAGGFLPRLPDSLEHLDLLLLTVAKSRKVRHDGIHFQGLCYLTPTLATYVLACG
jgi:putative transposase